MIRDIHSGSATMTKLLTTIRILEVATTFFGYYMEITITATIRKVQRDERAKAVAEYR